MASAKVYIFSFQLSPYFPHFGGPNSWRFIYNPYEILTIVRDSQGISYLIFLLSCFLIILQTEDGRLTVYCCDFFKMKAELLEDKCDSVFDRGAFEAIFEADREAYAKLVMSLVKPDFRYILNIYDYEGEYSGPPRSCKKEKVFSLFNGHKTGPVHESKGLYFMSKFQKNPLRYSGLFRGVQMGAEHPSIFRHGCRAPINFEQNFNRHWCF